MRMSLCATAAMGLILFAADAFAGIVVTQQREISAAGRVRKSEEAVMLEGHQRKIVTPDRIVITDLDKGLTYEIQRKEKTYFLVPFPPSGQAAAQLALSAAKVEYKRTGKSRKLNGYNCEEYTGIGTSKLATFRVSECVSSTVPGAKEISAFEKLMNSKLKGSIVAPGGDVPVGLAIQSVTTLRPEDVNPPAAATPQQAELLRKANAGKPPISTVVTVTKIEEKKLAPDTFKVPSGYTERQYKFPEVVKH
jgi:Domain of unknown function (DUF4412)